MNLGASHLEWMVYMIETRGGRLYTGITNDMEKRWRAHLSGKSGAKFFRIDPPRRLVWLETGHDRSQAARREVELKRFTRAQKLALISGSPAPTFDSSPSPVSEP